MVFSTIIFLCVFLPFSIGGYYLLPDKLKNLFLLICSLFFYAFGEPEYIWIMLASIAGNYGFGIWMHRIAFSKGDAAKNQKRKKAVVTAAVVANLGLLFVFKYAAFLAGTFRELTHGSFAVIDIALPIGISFYTFQGLSYIIDLYRKEGTYGEDGERISIVQKNPLQLALYIAMFPQLIAGPIVRYEEIRRQLVQRKTSLPQFASGIERFVLGLTKKAVFANVTGEMAEMIFEGNYASMSQSVAWLGAIAYTMQIYYDFSGYSDMAIGLGAMFGFRFSENFHYPYIATSVQEFWRRWHISLSSWFRDYLYIPLGGNRKGNVYLHLLIVFAATGIWHGAGWGFLVWGIWHGCFLIAERALRKRIRKSDKAFRISSVCSWLYTMLVVVTGWVVFRIVDIREALTYLAVMSGIKRNDYTAFGIRYYLTNRNGWILFLACLFAAPLLPFIGRKLRCDSLPVLLVKRISLLLLLAVCFLFIINSTYNPFIYFRF